MPSSEILSIKRDLFEACELRLRERMEKLEAALGAVIESRNGETKSSAGDKFETGRAMMQIEESKLRGQLAEATGAHDRLAALDIESDRRAVGPGALVATNRGNFFVATGIGKVVLNGRPFFCTSPGSPVAQALLGKSVGEEVIFNDMTFEVLELA